MLKPLGLIFKHIVNNEVRVIFNNIMNIQIDGIYFPNKGDELMYYAVVQAFKKNDNFKSLLVYGLGKGSPDPHILRNTGVFQLSDLQRYSLRIDRFIPKNTLYKYGLICPEDIDVILDSGGFQFGDQWEDRYSNKMTTRLERYYKYYRDRGVKIIQLPQALGPFDMPLSKKVISIVHQYSDLIFARDSESLKHIVDAVGTSSKIYLSPDFTCLLEGNSTVNNMIPKEFIAVIPNSKMLTHTDDSTSKNYINYLVNLLNKCISSGQQIVFLNHEGEGDNKLNIQINNHINNYGIILNNLNSIEIKSVIKQSKLLISSRFHGVVSGLSQGVPTFCNSWSHKYKELLKDYGVEDHLLDVHDVELSFNKIKPYFSYNTKHHSEQRLRIKEQKQKVIDMWETIFNMIRKNN